jgi:hypothetical protein
MYMIDPVSAKIFESNEFFCIAIELEGEFIYLILIIWKPTVLGGETGLNCRLLKLQLNMLI